MARKQAGEHQKAVDPQRLAEALARAIVDGDFVSFRTLFLPFSPGRPDSTEAFEDEKYAYLATDETARAHPLFNEALAMVQEPETWAHIQGELAASRPPQMPSNLLLKLADQALAVGKFTSASQAYELLRIRRRMQDEFLTGADHALDEGDIPRAVRGYRYAIGLDYDYAAFPEPLPKIPRYQTTALILHGVYPRRPEDAVGMQEPEQFLRTALAYLFDDAPMAARLENRSTDVLVPFLQEFIRQLDPRWDAFCERYRDALTFAREYGEQLNRSIAEGRGAQSLAEEIEAQQHEPPIGITVRMLGRTIPDGAWWQYLKELAYEHPAAPLFVARQFVGNDEILVPRLRANSPVTQSLDLLPPQLQTPA